MKIEYRSNNSGGSWWLSDEQWLALEAAGWTVEWVRDEEKRREARIAALRAEGKEKEASEWERWPAMKRGERWLGALATTATKDFPSPADAVREWERITGLVASDEGCNCCGAPHSFSWDGPNGEYGGYVSGEEVIPLLYENAPKSLREAAEQLAGRVGGLRDGEGAGR